MGVFVMWTDDKLFLRSADTSWSCLGPLQHELLRHDRMLILARRQEQLKKDNKATTTTVQTTDVRLKYT